MTGLPPVARQSRLHHAPAASRLRRINEPADAMPGQTRIASAAIGNFA